MSESLYIALALGFALGLKHATEADHLVAVTTIVSEQRSILRSAMVGVLWGVGHTAALALAGLLIIVLHVQVPARVAALFELAVAAMIVLLGARMLYLLFRGRERVHVHTHRHGADTHAHLHFHDDAEAHAPAQPHPHDAAGHRGLTGWRPVLIGMVHGLAGAAALPLLVLTEVMRGNAPAIGFAYLLIFGVGSIFGMLLMTTLISLPFVMTGARFERILTPMRFAVGLTSIAFGIYYAWEVAGTLT